MRHVLAALLCAWAFTANAAAQDCSYDRDAMLALGLDAFDQTEESGWRLVGNSDGCEAVAADLIADYRNTHAATLVNGSPEHIAGLNWHEAQLRAGAGQTARALDLFYKTRVVHNAADALYAQATIAFLQRNRPALLAAREDLAVLPKPDWFDATAARFHQETGHVITWPSNLDVVDGFIACWDRPYAEAYSSECRAPP